VLEQAVGPHSPAGSQGDTAAHPRAADEGRRLLDRRAFAAPLPPPSTDHLVERIKEHSGRQVEGRRQDVERASLSKAWLGPFLRCIDVLVPEFLPIFDIRTSPSASPRTSTATADEEVIYREGLFDVALERRPDPAVTLVADPSAFATPSCEPRPELAPAPRGDRRRRPHAAAQSDGRGTFPIINTTTGYAVRANRPHSSGQGGAGSVGRHGGDRAGRGPVEFWGCNHHLANGTAATHYRINARVSADEGPASGPCSRSWTTGATGASSARRPSSNTAACPAGRRLVGCAEPRDQWIPGDHYLLQWHNPPNGLVEMQLEARPAQRRVGDGDRNRAAVRLQIDNSAPVPQITALAWREVGGATIPLPLKLPDDPPQPPRHRGLVDIQVMAAQLRSGAARGRRLRRRQPVAGHRLRGAGGPGRADARLLAQERQRQRPGAAGGVAGAGGAAAGSLQLRASRPGAAPSNRATATCTRPPTRTSATTRDRSGRPGPDRRRHRRLAAFRRRIARGRRDPAFGVA
jgi:hypothetical protein